MGVMGVAHAGMPGAGLPVAGVSAGRRIRGHAPIAGLALLALAAAEPARAGGERSARPASALAALPYYEWSGLYVGGSIGYGRGSTDNVLADPSPTAASNVFGSTYGEIHIGYNYLLPSRILIGAEADISFPNFLEGADVAAARSTAAGGTVTDKVDYISTMRGRVGYAVDRWLIYGTGGFAWSQAGLIESPGAFTGEDKRRRLRMGWSLGGGVEVTIAPEWTARVEYIYDNFGSVSGTFASGTRFESTLDEHMLRFGLNRRLGGPETEAPGGSSG